MSAMILPSRLRITTDRYQKMVATGVLTKNDRVELIEGEILNMAPIGPRHAALTARLNRLFATAARNQAVVFVGGPINLGNSSEPQPDLSILKPRSDDYGSKIPEAADVLLLIEVSDSTLFFDQSVKLNLYARHRIPEYWVVDVETQRIVVYLDPGTQGYARKLEHGAGDIVAPQSFPEFKVSVAELFG